MLNLRYKKKYYYNIIKLVDFLFPDNEDFRKGGRSLSTAEVAAIIACPMFIICMLIMLIIWFYQRRKSQLPTYNGVNSEENHSVEIPPGMSIHTLSDFSTGNLLITLVLCSLFLGLG